MKFTYSMLAIVLLPMVAFGATPKNSPQPLNLEVDLFMYQGQQTLSLIGDLEPRGKLIGELDSKYLRSQEGAPVKMWYMNGAPKDLEFTVACSSHDQDGSCGDLVIQWKEKASKTAFATCSFGTKTVGPAEYFFNYDYSCDVDVEVTILNSVD